MANPGEQALARFDRKWGIGDGKGTSEAVARFDQKWGASTALGRFNEKHGLQIPSAGGVEVEPDKFLGGYGPAIAGGVLGAGVAFATGGAGLPAILAAEAIASPVIGSGVRGLENWQDGKDFFDNQSATTALTDAAIGVAIPSAFAGAGRMMGGGKRLLSGGADDAVRAADELPAHFSPGEAVPSPQVRGALADERAALRADFASRKPKDMPSSDRLADAQKVSDDLDVSATDDMKKSVAEKLRRAKDDLMGVARKTSDVTGRVDPNAKTWQGVMHSAREATEGLAPVMSAPARGARVRSIASGLDSEAHIGRAFEVEAQASRGIEQSVTRLRDQINQFLPPDSIVRTNLAAVAEGRHSVSKLTDMEAELFSRYQQVTGWIDEQHLLNKAITFDEIDGDLIPKAYASRQNYAPSFMKPDVDPANRALYGKLEDNVTSTTANRARNGGLIPDEFRVTDSDSLLNAIMKNDSQRVAHEMAWGGDQILANLKGATTAMPRHYADMLQEMERQGRNVTAQNMKHVAVNEMAPADHVMQRQIQGVKNIISRGLLTKNWTAQAAEFRRARGWADTGAYKVGRQYREANSEAVDAIKKRSSGLMQSVNDTLDDQTREFFIPHINGVADQFARTSGIDDYLGQAIIRTREARVWAKQGKLTLLQEQKMREILPNMEPNAAVKLLAKQGDTGIDPALMTDMVDAQVRRLFHTYTGASVAPGIRNPIGSVAGQFRVFGLNVGGQFMEDVVSPIARGRAAAKAGKAAGDAAMVAEGKELAMHGFKRMARTTAYMTPPGLLHRGLRLFAYTKGDRVDSPEKFGKQLMKQGLLRDVPSGIGGLPLEIGSGIVASMFGDRRALQMASTILPPLSATAGAVGGVAGAVGHGLQGDEEKSLSASAPLVSVAGGIAARRGGGGASGRGARGAAIAPRLDSLMLKPLTDWMQK